MTHPTFGRTGFRKRAFGAAVATLLAAMTATLVARDLEDFSPDWRFQRGDVPAAQEPQFKDEGWRRVDLPHDWSIELARDPATPEGSSVAYYPGGTGWYRKRFDVPADRRGCALDLVFDGVQQECEVWINGRALGFQPHGYVGFVRTVPADWLQPTGNVVAVRAVNPDSNSRWYSGSGLYRQVHVRYREPVDVATWGIRLGTVWVHEGKAQVQVRAELTNDAAQAESVEMSLRLHRPDGSTEDFALGRMRLAAGTTEEFGQLITVANAQLWSPSSPVLYTAELRVASGAGRRGGMSQTFGIRQLAVSAQDGFRLNGQPVELKGGCLHHDNGLLGAAAFPAAEWRRVALMKQNGFNAIRTSHNPPSAAFLDACDRLGVMVIDEFADTWEIPKKPNTYTRYFARHWEEDLRSMLRRDYNHPSIILWSIGNEVQERALPRGLEIARRMVAFVRAFDPERPVTNALCAFWDNPSWRDQWDRTAPAFALLDVGGYNYLWQEYERDHAKHPDRIMLGTESYPMQAYENWQAVVRLPYVIGDFVWTGMDHLGESGIGHTVNVPGPDPKDPSFFGRWPTWINWSGDVDVIGHKKPQSFYRDVVWDRSPVELAVHRPVPDGHTEIVSAWGWPDELPSWTWPGLEGRRLQVRVFSKHPRVRLELNGRVVGEQAIEAAQGIVATFEVPYEKGELKAVALGLDGAVAGTRTLVTTGPAATVVLAPELERVAAQRAQVIFVPVELRDAHGRWTDQAAAGLRAAVSGPVEVLAFGSADPDGTGSLQDLETNAFRGRALLILRSTGAPGRVRVAVESEGLTGGAAEFVVP